MEDTLNSREDRENILDRICEKIGYLGKFAKWINMAALVIFAAMIVCTGFDVFMRYVMKNAIPGMKEVTEYMLMCMIALSISNTFFQKRHITVDLFTSKLPEKVRACLDMAISALLMIFLALISYSCITQTIFYFGTHKIHGAMLQIPLWPGAVIMSFGFILSTILAVRAFLQTISNVVKLKVKAIAILITIIAFAAAMFIFGMIFTGGIVISKAALAFLALVIMFILMFSGMPVGYSLWFAGTLIVGNLRGITTAVTQIATLNYVTTSNYTWSVVGFFLLMGYLVYHAQFGTDMFKCIQYYLGRLRGGLAIVTIGASACLAAVVGDNNAVVSTMSAIAYPEMKKHNYNDRLATGTLAAGSCLGPLIPPSTGFITFSLLTSVSLGKLFAAGIIPGIILTLAFCLTISLICRRHPDWGPRGEKSTRKERISSLPSALPIIILFVIVIGGIMIGIFTATEGGAIGCIGAVVIALILRRLNFKNFRAALAEAGELLGMIFTVIVGAKVLSSSLEWCNLASVISGVFANLNFSPKVVVAIILLIFFIAGFFIDIVPLQFVGIPIFYPIVAALGIDGVWFGCLVIMITNCGVITPPFAGVLFVMRGLLPDVKINDIFKGVFPFVFATVVVVILLFLVPQLVTVLPNMI